MMRSWRMGTLFGIKLFVHPTFLLLPLILVMSMAMRSISTFTIFFHLGLLVAVFGCVVLHELGHALMARRFGIKTRDITLYPIGGVARLENMPERSWEELCIAVAGPAVNVAIAILLSPLVITGLYQGWMETAGVEVTAAQGFGLIAFEFALYLWAANIVLVVFNMMPTFPMDGGRVLRALLSTKLSYVRATEVAVKVGRAFAILALGALWYFAPGVLSSNPMLIVIGVFVFLAGQQELTAIRRREMIRQREEALYSVFEAPPIPEEPSAPSPSPNFSGVLWNPEMHVWMVWRNGQCVGVVRL